MTRLALRDEVAWEYLNDGGVLACQLEDGEYWQLGHPAGALWRLIVEVGDFAGIAGLMPEAGIDVAPVEAWAGLEAFCESLEIMGLLQPGWRPSPQ